MQNKDWLNPSKMLVDRAISRWAMAKQRADNTSVVTLMLDPPGPPKAQVKLLFYVKPNSNSSVSI